MEQKVTIGEIQQSIYGAVARDTRFKKSLVQFYGIALYIFLFNSLILFVHILVTVHSLFFWTG